MFLECRVFNFFYFRKFSSDFDVLGHFGNLKGGAKWFLGRNLIILINLEMMVTMPRHIISRWQGIGIWGNSATNLTYDNETLSKANEFRPKWLNKLLECCVWIYLFIWSSIQLWSSHKIELHIKQHDLSNLCGRERPPVKANLVV